MQIFFGACLFFIAVILLAYVPGKLVLLLLKRTLSPLEDVTLACVLGLLVSGLAYWLIAFTHQARLYILWPMQFSFGSTAVGGNHCCVSPRSSHHSTKRARADRATGPA